MFRNEAIRLVLRQEQSDDSIDSSHQSVTEKGDATLCYGSARLAEGDESEKLLMLRRNVEKGLPCGSEGFVQKLGEQVGRLLTYRPRGRPKKVDKKVEDNE